MRAPRTEAMGTGGASQAKADFEFLGWGVMDNPYHDLGTDLFLMARDDRGVDLQLLVGVQVKSGPSQFDAPVYDEAGTLRGWWFAADQDHFDYWLQHSIPHLVVLLDPETRTSYWAHITHGSVQNTGKEAKILVPVDQIVDQAHQEPLLEVAGSQRSSAAWEGSAWTGADALSPTELVRYAMIVPRLIAPHPNQWMAEITAEKCVALLVLVRIDEIDRKGPRGTLVPSMSAAAEHSEWRWRFVAVLRGYLDDGDPDALLPVAAAASEPADGVAGAVAAASALLECGRAQEAVALLETALDRFAAAHPVDYAWVQTQLARAYAEVGQLREARDLALAVQAVRRHHPQDLTATAIVGAAAQLVFTVSDLGVVDGNDDSDGNTGPDVAAVIRANDSTATWWRTQVLSWGLSQEADQRFVHWSGGEASTSGHNELRAVALLSSFNGHQGGWRHAASLLGRHELMLTGPTSLSDAVTGPLTVIRLSGDERNLKTAVRQVVRYGPATAARHAADELDLAASTRTTARADLTLVTMAGDVLTAATADRHGAWLLDVLAGPTAYIERLRPTFLVENAVLEALAALTTSVSDGLRRTIIEAALALAPQEDQLVAHGWRRVVRALPSESWTADEAQLAAERAATHNWELEYALLDVAARHLPSVKDRLVNEAVAGDFKAFDALGDIRDLPPSRIEELIAVAAGRIAAEREQARTVGSYAFGTDWRWLLTAINLCHPDKADWPAQFDLLTDPLAHPDHLASALAFLAARAPAVPPELRGPVLDALDQMLDRPRLPMSQNDLDQISRRAALALSETRGPDDARLNAMLAGNAASRSAAALAIGRRGNQEQLPILLALAYDENPTVRAGAAEAVGIWAACNGGDTGHELAAALLCDAGTRIPLRTVAGLVASNVPTALARHEDSLRRHLSATIRRRAAAQHEM